MSDDRFELILEPPPEPRRKGFAPRILAPDGPVMDNLRVLVSHSKEWGRIAVMGKSRSYVIRDDLRKHPELPGAHDGTWEFAVNYLNGEYGIWARFTPTPTE